MSDLRLFGTTVMQLAIGFLFFGLLPSVLLVARFLQPHRPPNPRLFPALLLSTLWTLPTLLILQRLAQHFQWWSFTSLGPRICGMPVDLYLAWVILWALVPQLLVPQFNPPEVVTLFFIADFWLMPYLPGLELTNSAHSTWLAGEAVALLLVLVPAQWLLRTTLHNTHLYLRATIQVVLSGILFLYFVPELVQATTTTHASAATFALTHPNCVISTGAHSAQWRDMQAPCAAAQTSIWQPLLTMPHVALQSALQLLFLLAVPGLTAVQEFAQRGRGTPIPYDPPQHLVTTGIYRYCANPMQLSCAVVMLAWSALLQNIWLAAGSVVTVIYSAGLATWDEHTDLTHRFGIPWRLYRAQVPAWRFRWRPYHSGTPARLYIARTCGPCSELRRWLEARQSFGLTILDAETLPTNTITRLRYEPSPTADPTQPHAPEEGIAALARALEHCNLAWAYCGFTLRLPLFHQTFQLLMDASGLGPRTLICTADQTALRAPGK